MKEVSLELPPYQTYCQAHKGTPECVAFCKKDQNIAKDECQGSTSETSEVKNAVMPTPASHLTNLTASFPQISKQAHILANGSMIQYSRSDKSMDILAYGSPWAVMKRYDPRKTIVNSRSTIGKVTQVNNGMK